MDKTSLLNAMFEQGIDPVEYFKIASEEMKIVVIENFDGALIKYMINPSEKIQLTAVRINPYVIQHIKNPTEKVKLESEMLIASGKFKVEYDGK